MINSIDLTKLRNPEYLQYQKDFATIVERNNDKDSLGVQAKYDALQVKITEMDALFKKVLANSITQELLLLDARRDNAINGFYHLVLGNTYHVDEAVRDAANALLANLRLYGSGIAKLNYQAETATISSIINDWENKTELAQALDTLQLNIWKEELETANTLYSNKYLDRTQDYGNATPENLKTKREETNGAYYALRDRINALDLLEEATPSPYSTVINQLNALVEQYNLLLSNRTPGGDGPTEDNENLDGDEG